MLTGDVNSHLEPVRWTCQLWEGVKRGTVSAPSHCFSPPSRWWKGEQCLASFSSQIIGLASPPPTSTSSSFFPTFSSPFSSRGAALWNLSSLGWECGTCHRWKEWIDCTSPWLCSLGVLKACSASLIGQIKWLGPAERAYRSLQELTVIGLQITEIQHPAPPLQNTEVTCVLINPPVLVQHGRF